MVEVRGPWKIVRCAMPAPIITVASTNAATAHTKRTNYPLPVRAMARRTFDPTFQTSETRLEIAREGPITRLGVDSA
ncbi:hypothetical protein GCM10009775_02620 [Microbacterium aoyamense]|uniref:Uncharacterized protein n=1 Tax=Microbacterium aoyamense TaxID=344166 RepID=A0ABP5AGQ1_9MICO